VKTLPLLVCRWQKRHLLTGQCPDEERAIMLLDEVGNSKVAPFAGSGTPSVAPRLCPASNQEGESIQKTI
jgi:hypothetical protein